MCGFCSVVGYLPPGPVSAPRNSFRKLRRIRVVAMGGHTLMPERVDLWHARLVLKRLRKDQRAAIAEAVEE